MIGVKPVRLLSVCVALGSLGFQTVYAADVRINGFASVTGGATIDQGSTPQGDAVYFVDGSHGGTYSDEITFRPDSLYGLQLIADMGDGLTATGQIVGTGANDFNAVFNWAFLSYELTPNTTLSAGRMGYPLYYYSDFLNVRYAYHWLRGPADTYTLPINEFEGVKLRSTYDAGSVTGDVQLFVGASESNLNGFPGAEPFVHENIIGGNSSIGNEWFELRFVALQADTYHENEKDIASDSRFFGVTAKFEYGGLLIIGEYTDFEFDTPLTVTRQPPLPTFLNEGQSGYLSVAFTFGDFTPHITYSTRETGIEFDTLGEFSAENETLTIGARWDFHPSAAAKVEFNQSEDKSSPNYQAIAGEALSVDTLAFGIDFVF